MLRFCVAVSVLFVGISGVPIEKNCDHFPSPLTVFACCGLPKLLDELVCVRTNRTPDGKKVVKWEEFPKCPGDCFFRDLNLLQNDSLIYDIIQRWLYTAVEDSERLYKLDVSTVECTELVENKKSIKDLESYPCNSKADFYLYCLQLKTISDCAADRWQITEYCREVKETVHSCPFPDVIPAFFRS